MSIFYEITTELTGQYLMPPKGPPGSQDPDRFVYRLMFEPGRIENVPALQYDAPDNVLPDWPAAVNGLRLVSPRCRQILQDQAGPNDDIQWLPVTVTTPDGQQHPYWAPHFPVWHDILDEEHTNIGPSGIPIRWVIATRKLEGHNIFTVPQVSRSTLMRASVLNAMKEAGITGYEAEPARQV
ncbi:hypothetical protein GCM10022223_32960 [Kineosporia mesophila]|uniref:Uncharacterized protein n=1 Tax=Kineosporia mesophila TaxID=566012 RepID=A0ABP6ZQ89_9ACTN|nr:hypothetical protein [Kineosporia mesophila]MCD5353708.1 hypothetical protein [Kineosporia mesophila]